MALTISKSGKREDPHYYMEIAVDVMNKSIDEQNKKNPSPRVGAVLVFPNGDYDVAWRGQFREGDHAEYTLLDKSYRTEDLSGCWLFATLEPCGPGARNEPKIPCAERIANARIEKVWFGVQELNSKASGGKTHLEKMGVQVEQFDKDSHKKIKDINNEFNDWVDEENEREKIADSINKGGLNDTFKNVDISSLSDDALQLYITKTGNTFSLGSEELYEDLLNKDLVEQDPETKKLIPNGNSILLFGENPSDKYLGAVLKVKADYGDGGKPETETYDKALVLIPDLVESWLRKVIASSVDTSSFTRRKIPHYPIEVIREAIINAIIHRDYTIDEAKVFLDVSPSRIEVRSPGKPTSPNTIEKLQNFSATQYSRNGRLANIFNKMGFMEEAEIGMETFKTLQEKYNFPSPVIKYQDPSVVVVFPRSLDAKRDLNDDLKNLNDEELKGYEYIQSKGVVSKSEYAEHFGFDDKKAYRHLFKMKKLELVGDNGESPKSNNYKYVFKAD
jgi:ATP-dependent DNA helicase RecG